MVTCGLDGNQRVVSAVASLFSACLPLARETSADRQVHLRMGPGVMTRLFYAYRTGGGQRLQPVLRIVSQASTALCRSIRRRVIGSGGRGGT